MNGALLTTAMHQTQQALLELAMAALGDQQLWGEKGVALGLADRPDALQAQADHDSARPNRIVVQKQALEILTDQSYEATDMPVLLPSDDGIGLTPADPECAKGQACRCCLISPVA